MRSQLGGKGGHSEQRAWHKQRIKETKVVQRGGGCQGGRSRGRLQELITFLVKS